MNKFENSLSLVSQHLTTALSTKARRKSACELKESQLNPLQTHTPAPAPAPSVIKMSNSPVYGSCKAFV